MKDEQLSFSFLELELGMTHQEEMPDRQAEISFGHKQMGLEQRDWSEACPYKDSNWLCTYRWVRYMRKEKETTGRLLFKTQNMS